MDFQSRRRLRLLESFRAGHLHLDGLVSVASQMGMQNEQILILLEEAADDGRGDGRASSLKRLLRRERHRMTREELVCLSFELGLSKYDTLDVLDDVGEEPEAA